MIAILRFRIIFSLYTNNLFLTYIKVKGNITNGKINNSLNHLGD